MKDKYNLTLEENIFLAKKMLVSNIYSNAKIEGCNVTFPETQTILDGVNVPNQFNKLLTEFYNTNEDEEIIEFLYNNCIFGIEK